jgi:hypothetical protein
MTCEIPDKFRHSQWHWMRHAGDQKWFVAEARNGKLWSGPQNLGAVAAYNYGWRYIKPAEPPTADECNPPVKRRRT